MNFGAPQWLWGLLLVPALIALFIRAERRGVLRLREFVSGIQKSFSNSCQSGFCGTLARWAPLAAASARPNVNATLAEQVAPNPDHHRTPTRNQNGPGGCDRGDGRGRPEV